GLRRLRFFGLGRSRKRDRDETEEEQNALPTVPSESPTELRHCRWPPPFAVGALGVIFFKLKAKYLRPNHSHCRSPSLMAQFTTILDTPSMPMTIRSEAGS